MLPPLAIVRARTSPARGALYGLALVFSVLTGGACDEALDPGTRAGHVHGSVRDAQTGAALKGVRLSFVSDTLEEAEARSNAEGNYSLHVESRSAHGRIEAHKAGYETRVASVFLDAPEVRIDLRLDPE